MNTTICGFLGPHAWELPSPFSPEAQLIPKLRALLSQKERREFYLILESGPSFLVAEEVLRQKESGVPIQLICIIPYEEQHAQWPEAERNRYFSILERCHREHMMKRPFSIDCYQESHRYLLSKAQLLLALWNGRASDVGDAIVQARKLGHEVIVVDAAAEA